MRFFYRDSVECPYCGEDTNVTLRVTSDDSSLEGEDERRCSKCRKRLIVELVTYLVAREV